MWLEEEPVHVGQLHLVVVKQQQLQGRNHRHSKRRHVSLLLQSRGMSLGVLLLASLLYSDWATHYKNAPI